MAMMMTVRMNTPRRGFIAAVIHCGRSLSVSVPLSMIVTVIRRDAPNGFIAAVIGRGLSLSEDARGQRKDGGGDSKSVDGCYRNHTGLFFCSRRRYFRSLVEKCMSIPNETTMVAIIGRSSAGSRTTASELNRGSPGPASDGPQEAW